MQENGTPAKVLINIKKEVTLIGGLFFIYQRFLRSLMRAVFYTQKF